MTNPTLTVSLSADIPDARLAQLTRDLERDLSRAGIQVRPIEAPQVPGERGEPITLGVIAIALVTSGAVTAMIECLKKLLSHEESKLTIRVMHKDGMQIEVSAQNVHTPAVREALEAVVSAGSK